MHQFLGIGKCGHCKIDRDLNHYPNNLDCPNYKEMRIYLNKNTKNDKDMV